MSLYTYRAKIDYSAKNPIYDADTVRLIADLGFGVTLNLGPCRLYGINAPELRGKERPKGIVARDWLRALMAGQEEFTIQTFKDEKGKYGRYLCLIKLDDGTNVNDALVEHGHAERRVY